MDPDIFDIFLSKVITKSLPIIPLKPENIPVTPYRSVHYTLYLNKFFGLLELITELKDAYSEYYAAKGDTDTQKKTFLSISELQRKIRKLADITKLLVVTRHGETPSDMTH